MPRVNNKMLVVIASFSTLLVQLSSQSSVEVPQTIFLATNSAQDLSYPDCLCDNGPSCDSCRDYSVLISCEGCDGTYFKENPTERKIELDGSWSPEGQEFELELKIVVKEGSQPHPQKVKIIRVPKDCVFSAFIQKSQALEPKRMINYNAESHLSEVFLGPFSDFNCGALDYKIQGKCFSFGTQSDQSVTLVWDPSKKECGENYDSFLTISIKQHPRVRLDLDVWALLSSQPGQKQLFGRFELLNNKERSQVTQTFAEPRNLNHVGTDCATSFAFAPHTSPAFTYEDCSGPYTYIPEMIVTPVGCVPQIIYVDWDLSGGLCPSSAPDKNVITNVSNIPPVISSLNLCGWISAPQVGDSNSFTIDSCSETTNTRFTTQFSTTQPTTYSITHYLYIMGTSSELRRTDSFDFVVQPHCTDVTTMIAPTLPPMSFDFAAGMPQYTLGYIPAFDDTVSAPNTKKCGKRTCTSDSPYAVWSQADQKFAIGTTGWQKRTDVPGDHAITLTCGLTTYPLVTQVSSSWTLKLAASCYSAVIIAPVVQPNYDVYSGTIDVTTIPKFQDTNSVASGIDGTGSDLCGSRYCTSNSPYAIISATQDITIKAISGSFDTGVFPVTITCALGYSTTPSSQTINFTVTVKPCVYSSIIATTVMSGSAAPLVQTVLGPSLSWSLDSLTSTAPLNCQYTFTYHVQMLDGSTDFTPFGGTLSTAVPPVLTIYTTNNAAKGTYYLQWYVTSTTNPSQAIVYVDFQVQIGDCIVLSTTGTSYVTFTRTQNLFSPIYSSTLSLRTQVPACGYSQVYSCTVKEVGTSVWTAASWCATTATNLEISTNDYLLDLKSYYVQQTVKIGLIYSEGQTSPSTVTFADPCKTSTFVNQNVPNQLYFITSEGLPSLPFVFPWLDDTINQSLGTSTTESICYKSTTVFIDSGITPRYAMISQKPDGSSDVTISTTETNLAGIHTLQASYTFQRYLLIPAKQISATIKLYQLQAPKAIDKIYHIKELALKFTVDAFSALPASLTLECVQKITLSDGKPLPSFITLIKTDTQFQFSVQSSDDNNAGTYKIQIAAQFSEDSRTFETSTTFKVVVTASQQAKQMNQPPAFDSKLDGPFNLKIGDNWSYKLPTYSDPESQNVTLTVDLDTAGMFIANQNSKFFTFTTTTAINVGIYTIKLKLTDAQGASKKYSFDISIQDLVVENSSLVNNQVVSSEASNQQLLASLESTPEWNWLAQFQLAHAKGSGSPIPPIPPTVKFSQISILGEVVLTFSKPMMTPPLSLFRTVAVPKQSAHRFLLGNNYRTQAITVLSSQGDPEDHTDLNFSYNVTSYQGQTMKIQVDFSTASQVSQNHYQDILQIIFNGNYMFFDTEGMFIDKDTTITYQLPSQLQFNTTETKLVVQATEVAQESSTVVMSGNLIVNVLLSAALNQLFSMVRIQQIVMLMPLFNVRLPGNAALFFGFALQIASFDLIPMNDLYDQMFPNTTTKDVLSPNFAQLGISSNLFLYNFGSLILAFVAIPVVLIGYPLLIPCKGFDRIEKIRRKIWTATFFNNTIRTILESYLILVLCVSINTLDLQWTEPGQIVNSICTICFGLTIIVFPLLACIFVYKNFAKLEEKDFEESYGAFYENLELRRGRGIVWQIGFFFLRRVLIPIVVVYNDALIVQVMAVAYTTVGQVIILGSVKPLQGGNQAQLMELFSECILMMILYTMMMFTDFVPDLDTRKYIGYASIVLVAIHLLVSFGVMLISSIGRLSNRIKWFFIRRKNIKIRQAIQEKALTAIKPTNTRMDVIKEVDASLEESHRSSVRSRIQSGRSALNSQSSRLSPSPETHRQNNKSRANSATRFTERDQLFEADLDQVEREAEANNNLKKESVLFDGILIDIEKQHENDRHQALEQKENEAIRARLKLEAEALREKQRASERRALDMLPENQATLIIPDHRQTISQINQKFQQLRNKKR